jgi:prepilin-type N-terminal cleavage/methylation domain-containing protein
MIHIIRERRHSTGFSLLELVIVVCIVAVLVAIAADRLLVMRATAERANVETTIGSIRSALGIKVAKLLARGNPGEVALLANSNPMDVLAEPPERYRGMYFGVDAALFSGGDWYYDSRDHAVTYVLQYDDLARGKRVPGSAPLVVRYSIRLVYDDLNGNKSYDPGVDLPTGVRLALIGSNPWADR